MDTLGWIIVGLSIAVLLVLIIGAIIYSQRKKPSMIEKINTTTKHFSKMDVNHLYEEEEEEPSYVPPGRQEALMALKDDPQNDEPEYSLSQF